MQRQQGRARTSTSTSTENMPRIRQPVVGPRDWPNQKPNDNNTPPWKQEQKAKRRERSVNSGTLTLGVSLIAVCSGMCIVGHSPGSFPVR